MYFSLHIFSLLEFQFGSLMSLFVVWLVDWFLLFFPRTILFLFLASRVFFALLNMPCMLIPTSGSSLFLCTLIVYFLKIRPQFSDKLSYFFFLIVLWTLLILCEYFGLLYSSKEWWLFRQWTWLDLHCKFFVLDSCSHLSSVLWSLAGLCFVHMLVQRWLEISTSLYPACVACLLWLSSLWEFPRGMLV